MLQYHLALQGELNVHLRTIISLIVSLKTVLPGMVIFDVAGGPDPIAVAAEIEHA